jgi:site-specific DNA-methyltransferase (adenine-specific)
MQIINNIDELKNLNQITPDSIINADCLDAMCYIADKSIDLILCDLPYGTTACAWDVVIPFDKLWQHYERVISDNGAICLFGSEPFSSHLRLSNIKLFKYDWIWEKSKASNYVHAKFQPLKAHESISVFSKSPAAQNKKNWMNYYPQKTQGVPYNYGKNNGKNNEVLSKGAGERKPVEIKSEDGKRYPRSVQYFRTAESEGGFSPTQKPNALLEYIIKTYTKERDLVLDNCAGSGSTLLAARNLNRTFIGIEKEEKYFEIIKNRLSQQ